MLRAVVAGLAAMALIAPAPSIAATPAPPPSAAPAESAADRIDAPNVVVISPQLVTSGQPSAAALGKLAAQGFKAVIYLAPPGMPDAVSDEPDIVQRQGLRYVNIPIRFGKPTEADFNALNAALRSIGGDKVLVHCQVNMRASSMVFLHRVVVDKQPPDRAYESVARVWSPDPVWKQLIKSVLANHGVTFEPY